MVRTIAKDHDDKRQKILKQAAEVFAREGITRASMNQVAEHCGISKANIYHYYNGKDALIFDILDQYLSGLTERVISLNFEDLEPAEQLEKTILEILIAYDGVDHEHKIQTEGLPLLDKQQQQVLKEHQRKLVGFVSNVIEAVAPDYFAGDEKRLRDVTMSIFGMLNWFYMWNANADLERREEYAKIVSDLSLKGLARL